MAELHPTEGPPTGPIPGSRHEREKDREFVLDFIDRSERKRRPHMDVRKEILDNYMVTLPGANSNRLFNPNGFRLFGDGHTARSYSGSRLKDPESHQITESMLSQGVGLLLGPRDYIQAIPVGSDDPDKARMLSKILLGVLDGPGVWRTFYLLLKDSFIFGTSVVQVGWANRTRQQMTKVPTFDQSGIQTGFEFIQAAVNYENRPDILPISLEKFYPDASGTRIQEDMQGVAKESDITVAQALRLAKDGVFDETAVRAAITRKKDRVLRTRMSEDRYERVPNQEKSVPVLSDAEESGLVKIFEYWGQVPYLPADKARNRVITLMEDVLVRSHINPFIDGNIPFKEVVVNPIQGRFWGVSPLEVIRYLQDSADAILMNLTDAQDLAVNGPIILGKAFGGDPNQVRRRSPRSIIMARDVKQVAPFPVDLNSLQQGAQAYLQRKMAMREATGATNPLQAIQNGDRSTAFEVSELVRVASQKVELMIQGVEKDDFPWIGRAVLSRLRQFLPDEGAVATLAGEQVPFTLDDIDTEADVRFVGSRLAKTPGQKFQQTNTVLTMIGQNPLIFLTAPELLEELFEDGLGIKDAKEKVAQGAAAAQKLLEQGALQGGAGTPGQGESVSPGGGQVATG